MLAHLCRPFHAGRGAEVASTFAWHMLHAANGSDLQLPLTLFCSGSLAFPHYCSSRCPRESASQGNEKGPSRKLLRTYPGVVLVVRDRV